MNGIIELVIVGAAIAAALVFALVRFSRSVRGDSSSCGCGGAKSSSCAGCEGCGHK